MVGLECAARARRLLTLWTWTTLLQEEWNVAVRRFQASLKRVRVATEPLSNHVFNAKLGLGETTSPWPLKCNWREGNVVCPSSTESIVHVWDSSNGSSRWKSVLEGMVCGVSSPYPTSLSCVCALVHGSKQLLLFFLYICSLRPLTELQWKHLMEQHVRKDAGITDHLESFIV